MAKRESKYIRDLKRQLATNQAKRAREAKKKSFEEVMAKEKVETYGDIIGIFNGLSRNAIDLAAYHRIAELARFRKTPLEIIEIMEPKKPSRKENAND
jgi:hypothetical protein